MQNMITQRCRKNIDKNSSEFGRIMAEKIDKLITKSLEFENSSIEKVFEDILDALKKIRWEQNIVDQIVREILKGKSEEQVVKLKGFLREARPKGINCYTQTHEKLLF